MSASDPVVILSYARTPMGGMLGSLTGATATELGAAAVREAVARAGVSGDAIERIYMGCVLPAGLGQAPARQAALKAGLPDSVEATTVNKMCGSGMQTAIMGAEALDAGSVDMLVAGGMESMTNAPYLLMKHRQGARVGHDKAYDHMFLDGLEDAYEVGRAMGSFAEETAQTYQFTRDQMDDYAVASLSRAQRAQQSGDFDREMVSVEVKTRKGSEMVDKDEQPLKADPSKIPTLKAAFAKDGSITAGTSSSISDGAAALVMTRLSVAEKMGLKPIAKIVATGAHARKPAEFTIAPVDAIAKTLKRAGWKASEVDLYEINEAFAVVPMIAMRDLGLSHDVVNVNGGACALGHPIGASGARIIATLLGAMENKGAKRGLASLCIGGGEATAVALELID